MESERQEDVARGESGSKGLRLLGLIVVLGLIAVTIVGGRQLFSTGDCPHFTAKADRVEREKIWSLLGHHLKHVQTTRDCEASVGEIFNSYSSSLPPDQVAASTINDLERAGWTIERRDASGELLVCAARRLFDDTSGQFRLYTSSDTPRENYSATITWSTDRQICL